MQRIRPFLHLVNAMKIWRLIPVLMAAAAILPACNKDASNLTFEENPDNSVKITYMGKGFNNARYGDIFQIETGDDFRYDFTVVTGSQISSLGTFVSLHLENIVGNLNAQNIDLDDYFAAGTGSYIHGILPQGDYKALVMEVDGSGKSTGVCYTKSFSVSEYISYAVDGALSPQVDWKAEYLGRYEDVNGMGNPILCDRISSSGTGDAYYYHVLCPAGSIKTERDLLDAFQNGSDVDDLKGGNGLLEWYKMLAPNFNYQAGLDWLLAKGGKDVESGYMDYTLTGTGTYDVYTVEMLLNGHITGRYGKTTLKITGTPNIKAIDAVRSAGKIQMRKMRL